MEAEKGRAGEDERLRFAAAGPADLPEITMKGAGAEAEVETRGPSSAFRRTSWAPAGRRRSFDWPAFRTSIARAVDEEWERGTAFLFLPILMGAGALAYFVLPSEPGFLPLAGLAALAAGLVRLCREHPGRRLVALGLLAIALGLLAGKIETWRAGTRMMGSEVSTWLTARVASIEHQASGRVRLILDVLLTERPELRYAPERVRVSARKIPAEVQPGSVVSGVVRLRAPPGPLRPQSYDFSFESYFDGIGASGFFLIGPEIAPVQEEPPLPARLSSAVERMRGALAARIVATIGGEEGQIAAALIAGVRAGIPEEVNEDLRRTGLAHILSISGLHMALVAGSVMTALRAGFALFPAFASRRPVKKYAALAALAAAGFYLFISGAAVAAERSFIMIAVMLAAVLVDRQALTMRNLAIAALIVLAVSPHEVVGPSFQMSFAATAALIAAYAAWSERRARKAEALPSRSPALRILRTALLYALGLAATSIIAGLATGLYGAWHFQRVSPLGLPANLLAMPVVSLLVMPFAVLAAVLMPLGLDAWPLAVMGWGISIMLDIAAWLSARSPLDAVGTIPLAPVAVLTIALVIATAMTTWLRAAALPLLAVGGVMLFLGDRPSVYVSEDARMVGVVLDDSRMAFNRNRPSAFTAEGWMRAAAVDQAVKPVEQDEADLDARQAAVAEEAAVGRALPEGGGSVPFSCDEHDLCQGRTADGALVVHAQTAEQAARFCESAALIVIDDATADYPCGRGGAWAITARDLALEGAATVRFEERDGGSFALVEHAIPRPYRPWHEHRRYSREARGLPPYQRKKAPTEESGTDPATAPLPAKEPVQSSTSGEANSPTGNGRGLSDNPEPPEAGEEAPTALPPLNSAGSAPPAGPAP